MRMAAKNGLFIVSYVLGAFIVWIVGLSLGLGRAAFALVFAWFLVFGIGQFFVLRCPHCRKCATITPNGMATPFVGKRCRHCGKEY